MRGIFYALTQVYTRKYCKGESPLALSFWLTACFLVVGLLGTLTLAFLPTPETVSFLTYPLLITDLGNTLIIVAIAAGSLAMHFSLAAAYQNAPASLIAPLEYLYIPVVVVGGYLFFQEMPNSLAVAGISLILLSGGIITWRERVISRHTVTAPVDLEIEAR